MFPMLLSLVLLSHAHVLVTTFKAFCQLLRAFDIHIYPSRSFDFTLQHAFCCQYSLEIDLLERFLMQQSLGWEYWDRSSSDVIWKNSRCPSASPNACTCHFNFPLHLSSLLLLASSTQVATLSPHFFLFIPFTTSFFQIQMPDYCCPQQKMRISGQA